MNAKYYIYAAVTIVYSVALCIVYDHFRPAKQVTTTITGATAAAVVQAAKPQYVPPEAPDPQLGQFSIWLLEEEENTKEQRAQKVAAFKSWCLIADSAALDHPPIDPYSDYDCAVAYNDAVEASTGIRPPDPLPALDSASLAQGWRELEEMGRLSQKILGYRYHGFCFVPGITAGLESPIKDAALSPVGYFDVEWAYWRRFNVATGLNTESVKPLHLRYRLPLFTNNLQLGAWGSLPYADWKGVRAGAGLSVGF